MPRRSLTEESLLQRPNFHYAAVKVLNTASQQPAATPALSIIHPEEVQPYKRGKGLLETGKHRTPVTMHQDCISEAAYPKIKSKQQQKQNRNIPQNAQNGKTYSLPVIGTPCPDCACIQLSKQLISKKARFPELHKGEYTARLIWGSSPYFHVSCESPKNSIVREFLPCKYARECEITHDSESIDLGYSA
jgi:hypothetical protein